MNPETHHTPRIRRDVVKELNDDACAIPDYLIGSLDFIRKESARRDSLTTAEGAQRQIREVLGIYFARQGVVLDDMSPGFERVVIHQLLRGREVDLPMWLEIFREAEAEFGDAQGEVTHYSSEVIRTDPDGEKTVARFSLQF